MKNQLTRAAPPMGLHFAEAAETAATMATSMERQIRRDIINGHLRPGERLRVSQLANRYATGPIPLREALSRLLTSGLVLAEDQKGFRVAEISATEFADICNVRMRIEPGAIRQSIETGDSDWEVRVVASQYRLSQLSHADKQGVIAGKNDEWEKRHREFHLALASGCNSPILLNFINTLQEHSARYNRVAALAPRAGGRALTDEHKAIAKAALDRNADEACALIEAHFSRTAELIWSVLKVK